MSSSRLPGKALRSLGGEPLLLRVVNQVQRGELVSQVVVATSTDESDNEILRVCRKSEVLVDRGPLEDLTSRLISIADRFGASAFVRISGDSPLIDPGLIDRGIRLFLSNNVDLVTNVHPRSFPQGQSVEVISLDALKSLRVNLNCDQDREHVTTAFYRNSDVWRILNFAAEQDFSGFSHAVDRIEDFLRIEEMIRLAGNRSCSWEDWLRLEAAQRND